MIKHHPSEEWLTKFVSGDLPASISSAIAIHAEMCPVCQAQIELLTEKAATALEISEAPLAASNQSNDEVTADFSLCGLDIDDMIADITSDNSIEPATASANLTLEVKGNSYPLPRALNAIDMGSFSGLGKISRAKLQLNEGEIHTHLLHMEAGGKVPVHTHKGYELTLLLAGTFSDDMGEYSPGDFILLDGQHQHQPYSKDGCLCLTVVNDALHFTQGISKLLNPIGQYIY